MGALSLSKDSISAINKRTRRNGKRISPPEMVGEILICC